jgi:hypothetical protein
VTAAGRRAGVKVELFDVRDIANPQSLGAEIIGKEGTFSEGLSDPHALTFLDMPGTDARLRLAMPILVYDTPSSMAAGSYTWTYSGLHLFEVAAGASPSLHFKGVIKTAEPGGPGQVPFFGGDRGVLHGDAVYAVHGGDVQSSFWQNVPQP